MKVVYQGPGDGVTLAPVHGSLWCPHGVPIDVPVAVGRSLCEQGTFAEHKAKRPTARAEDR